MQQTMISNAVGEEEHLAHYGVKGMHWGVWNSETAARYSRVAKRGIKASGQVMLKGAKAVHQVSKEHAAKSKAARSARRQSAADRRKQRAELGMDPYKYAKLRKKTLKSHDPEVVAKGMHTLTDEELGAKIRRLQQEDVIARMAASRATDRHRVSQARSQAIGANPLYRLGESYVKKAGDRLLDSVMPKPIKGGGGKKKKKNKNNGGGNNNSNQQANNSNQQANNSSKNSKHKDKDKPKDTSKPASTSSATYERGKDYVDTMANRKLLPEPGVIDLGYAKIVDDDRR